MNCRILPGYSREEIRQQLVHVVDDPKIAVHYVDDEGGSHDTAPSAKALPPAALRTDVMATLHTVVAMMWPGVPIIPSMSTGASDGVWTNAAGMPTYGISGIAIDTDDVRAHGQDERVPIASYYKGVDFYYRFMTLLTTSSDKKK